MNASGSFSYLTSPESLSSGLARESSRAAESAPYFRHLDHYHCQNHSHFSGRPEATHSLYGHTAAGVSLTCRQFASQVSQAWPLDLQQPQAGSQVCSPTSGPKYRSRPSSTQTLVLPSFPREKLRQDRKAGTDGDIRRTGWGRKEAPRLL